MSYAKSDHIITSVDGDPPEIARALAQAMLLHHIGQLQAAIDLYKRILARQPDHPEALRCLDLAAREIADPNPSPAS